MTLPPSADYPLIESVVDSFGTHGQPPVLPNSPMSPLQGAPARRLDVGERLVFTCRGLDHRGRELEWFTSKQCKHVYPRDTSQGYGHLEVTPTSGGDVTLEYIISEEGGDVREDFVITVFMRTVTGKYRRHLTLVLGAQLLYDDARTFTYAVRPPL